MATEDAETPAPARSRLRQSLFILAIAPQFLSADFEDRLARQLERLSREYGVHIPGETRASARWRAGSTGITLPRSLIDSISSFRRN